MWIKLSWYRSQPYVWRWCEASIEQREGRRKAGGEARKDEWGGHGGQRIGALNWRMHWMMTPCGYEGGSRISLSNTIIRVCYKVTLLSLKYKSRILFSWLYSISFIIYLKNNVAFDESHLILTTNKDLYDAWVATRATSPSFKITKQWHALLHGTEYEIKEIRHKRGKFLVIRRLM